MTEAHFRFLMSGIVHYGLIWWASRKRLQWLMSLHGFDRVQERLDAGENIIILLSHCTGLEFAVSAISQNFPSCGPYKAFKNPVMDWLIARARQRFDCIAFTREEGLRPLVKHARKGRVIIYLADEDLGPDVSVFAPFFGTSKATITMLGRLAKACKASVVPAISCYDPEQHRYHIHLLEKATDFPSLDEAKDAEMMNQMIESTIALCPAQYFWTLKFFKTRPPGEKGFYD